MTWAFVVGVVFYRVRAVFSRVFNRLERPERVAGGTLGATSASKAWAASRLHAGEDVLVGLDGEGDVGVTEPFADHLHRDEVLDEQGAVGVAEVVQSDHGDAGAADDPLEGLGEGVGVDLSAVGVGEHPSGIIDADGVVFGGLEGPPAA